MDRRRCGKAAGRLFAKVRRACLRWDLLPPGEPVAIGISGGPDSLALVAMLARRNRMLEVKSRLVGLHVALRGDGEPWSLPEAIRDWCREQGVEVETVVPRVDPGEAFPMTCFRCAGIRRRTLLEAADARGCSRLALGHHADDVVETWLMSLFYTGTGDVLPPVRSYFGGVVTVVRPMYEAPAREIRRVASLCGYPVDPVRCPVEGSARRNRVREVLAALGRDQRRVRRVLFRTIVRSYGAPADGVVESAPGGDGWRG